MVWTISYSDRALKSLRKMDKQNARRIVDFMDLRIAVAADPRQSGKPLKGELVDILSALKDGDSYS